MAAIRAKRHKVAEYLIDQLAINVNHSTELIEFRTNTAMPIRECTLTCRDLAYDKGMMDLVDLIDITSDEVKPSIKRYLQRRLKNRLDEIHQAYLQRLDERSHRLIIQSQESKNQPFEKKEQGREKKEQGREKEEEESENEEIPIVNTADDGSLPLPPPPSRSSPLPQPRSSQTPPLPQPPSSHTPPLLQPPQPPLLPLPPSSPPLVPQISARPYKSRIEETIQKIESKNDQSIDESGKKLFRFSSYALRYRLVETTDTNQQINERSRLRPKSSALPFIPSTTTQPLPSSFSRSATTMNINSRSISEISGRLPIRETRTSICRSARRTATPRVVPTANYVSKPEVKHTTTTMINTTQRLLPKRIHRINTNYGYIHRVQHALYNEPRHFVPITLRATAVDLSSNTRLVRD